MLGTQRWSRPHAECRNVCQSQWDCCENENIQINTLKKKKGETDQQDFPLSALSPFLPRASAFYPEQKGSALLSQLFLSQPLRTADTQTEEEKRSYVFCYILPPFSQLSMNNNQNHLAEPIPPRLSGIRLSAFQLPLGFPDQLLLSLVLLL